MTIIYKMYKSQYGQDKWVNENVFHNKEKGVFVDVGAHDGVNINNTYFFEKELGWTGICVEPNPFVYQQLCKNRRADCIHGCVYNKEGTIAFQWLEGYTEMLSGVVEAYNEKHQHRVNRELEHHGGTRKTIDVYCYTLKKLLEDRNITHVDYLSIDTEGSELQVLQGIDFEKVTFGIIDVEVNYPEEEHLFTNFLQEKGYHLLSKIGGDCIYQKNE